jgi:hypothetical protein
MAFLTGLVLGAVVVYGLVKLGLKRGDKGNFMYCQGCPYRFPTATVESTLSSEVKEDDSNIGRKRNTNVNGRTISDNFPDA